MNRFDREHVDGVGDGLSIALGVVEHCATLGDAHGRITRALKLARAAKDRDTLRQLEEFTNDPYVEEHARP